MSTQKDLRRLRIRKGIRRKIHGSADKPRLSIYKSNTGIYAQIIDDVHGTTLVYANSRELGHKKNVNVEKSKAVGKTLAEKAKSSGIEQVVFDRGGYLFHGNVKALAEGAREGGLKF